MVAFSSFGTTRQVKSFLAAHGLGEIEQPEDIRAARELISEERARHGLPAGRPVIDTPRVAPAALLVHADEEATSLQFGHPDWVMVR